MADPDFVTPVEALELLDEPELVLPELDPEPELLEPELLEPELLEPELLEPEFAFELLLADFLFVPVAALADADGEALAEGAALVGAVAPLVDEPNAEVVPLAEKPAAAVEFIPTT